MKSSFFTYLLSTLIGGALIYSCVKKNSYPTTPEIEYQAFYPYVGDSADLQVKFTDGDGDIGVTEGDSTKKLWITYYYWDTVKHIYTGYFRPLFNDTLRTGYIVKSPADSYKGKPISGEISVRLQQMRHSKKIKNIKYVVYLLDAAGNKSNVLTTPEIRVE